MAKKHRLIVVNNVVYKWSVGIVEHNEMRVNIYSPVTGHSFTKFYDWDITMHKPVITPATIKALILADKKLSMTKKSGG